jgi:diguanylate cyclase (GGDEF)-like protein
MTKHSSTGDSAERGFSGLFIRFVTGYLQTCTPEGTLERVLRSAGETRTVTVLSDVSTWSSYAQFRSLLEATGEATGGLSTFSEIGQRVFNSIQSPELVESLSALGSPEAVYDALAGLAESTSPITDFRIENVGPNNCRISIRLKDGYEPFPEFCALSMGLYAAIPTMFGYPTAEITDESCQCDGATFCCARLHWESVDDDATRAARAELQARVSQARLEELQRTVAELVSGDGLDTVLTRVMAAAARAVPAVSYVLDIRASSTADRWLCSQGIDSVEGARLIDELSDTRHTESASHVCLTEISSDRAHYGTLLVVRPQSATFEPHEHPVIESYARLAANALDSAAAIADARQQATTAQALLTLSSSLADLASTEEMVFRLAHAIPSVINCDRVCVWLTEPGNSVANVGATYGFDHDVDSELRTLDIPLPPTADFTSTFRHDLTDDTMRLSMVLSAAGSVAALSFPIIYGNEMYGWITVDVIEHPERFNDNADVTDRLRGLAGQAAIAIRNARLLHEIRHQAMHDGLTGLPNRVLMLDRVFQTLARARREHFEVALLFIDLDGFKDINDTLGHAMGDRLLQAVAARFAGTLRESDTVARLGGDEFVVLAEGLSLAAGPELLAERLLGVLAEPFHLDDSNNTSVSVSASIGIAVGLRESAEELLRDADIALYAAKDEGRNGFVVFEAEMQSVLRRRHELESDLQAAIGTDQFFLLYQPIFDLGDMTVVGVEALLRWRHPVRGLLQPDDFIPALEASGLIIPAGRWVLEEACRQAMAWRREGRVTRMSVNASARQLDADSLLDDVRRALTLSGLPPDDLIIEITETSIMRNTISAQKQLTALKSLGVRIAIDDFGTGYSSLSYLQQFPVDSLKIDRAFISGMAKTPEGDALIHTLMQLGKALHLETLAEGIEESGQLTQLQTEQCDVGQGFLFARPLPPEEVEVFLKPAGAPADAQRVIPSVPGRTVGQ